MHPHQVTSAYLLGNRLLEAKEVARHLRLHNDQTEALSQHPHFYCLAARNCMSTTVNQPTDCLTTLMGCSERERRKISQ